jgi:PadR family transcriptional regulator PadR
MFEKEQFMFQKRTSLTHTQYFFHRSPQESADGMDYAYIDCESKLEVRNMMISKPLMAASTRPLILAILSRGEDYGYSIIQKVKEISGGSLEWTDGMLYPVLQRMEMDELIVSQWKLSGESRRRRYYTITEKGREELVSDLVSWRKIWQSLTMLVGPLPAED